MRLLGRSCSVLTFIFGPHRSIGIEWILLATLMAVKLLDCLLESRDAAGFFS